MQEDKIMINEETCMKCGLCSEVCPNRIIKKGDSNQLSFRQDRIQFCFQCGQCMAICPTESIHIEGLSYSKDFFDLPESDSFEKSFFNMIVTRRAVRNFKDKPVPRELLEKIVQAIAFAPPGFPPIKTEIVVVQDTALIRKALPLMIGVFDFLVKAMANPMMRFFIKRRVGREKFNLLVHHVVPLMKNRLPELKMGVEDTITREAPAMILFHANRNTENYKEDIYVALTYGFLAAHALGLGGSALDIIPPPIERNKELRKMFLIPDTNEVVASMILGYPKYNYKRAIKRELKSVRWI
jgi:ferredoxin